MIKVGSFVEVNGRGHKFYVEDFMNNGTWLVLRKGHKSGSLYHVPLKRCKEWVEEYDLEG
jgi:hypothetical protein